MEDYYRGYRGDTRSLDHGSHNLGFGFRVCCPHVYGFHVYLQSEAFLPLSLLLLSSFSVPMLLASVS